MEGPGRFREGVPPVSRFIGVTVRARRKLAGLTPETLALRAGVSRAAIQFVENGRRMPGVELLERLCMGLGITLLELLAEADRRSRF